MLRIYDIMDGPQQIAVEISDGKETWHYDLNQSRAPSLRTGGFPRKATDEDYTRVPRAEYPILHSQTNIEARLDALFPNPGTFLEIGCWNGELISQTAYLEQSKGWVGVCVDPFPTGFENRTCRVCAKAISKDGLPRPFIKVSIDRRHGGDVSYFSGFKDSVKTHWDMIREFCDYQEIQVETITMQRLYQEYDLPPYIDFLSVDTEGAELEIFQSIDFSICSFGMIIFEHNEDAETKRAIGEILESNGYTLLDSLRCDDIYVKGEK
jgi:FkbM family methyltransferase